MALGRGRGRPNNPFNTDDDNRGRPPTRPEIVFQPFGMGTILGEANPYEDVTLEHLNLEPHRNGYRPRQDDEIVSHTGTTIPDNFVVGEFSSTGTSYPLIWYWIRTGLGGAPINDALRPLRHATRWENTLILLKENLALSVSFLGYANSFLNNGTEISIDSSARWFHYYQTLGWLQIGSELPLKYLHGRQVASGELVFKLSTAVPNSQWAQYLGKPVFWVRLVSVPEAPTNLSARYVFTNSTQGVIIRPPMIWSRTRWYFNNGVYTEVNEGDVSPPPAMSNTAKDVRGLNDRVDATFNNTSAGAEANELFGHLYSIIGWAHISLLDALAPTRYAVWDNTNQRWLHLPESISNLSNYSVEYYYSGTNTSNYRFWDIEVLPGVGKPQSRHQVNEEQPVVMRCKDSNTTYPGDGTTLATGSAFAAPLGVTMALDYAGACRRVSSPSVFRDREDHWRFFMRRHPPRPTWVHPQAFGDMKGTGSDQPNYSFWDVHYPPPIQHVNMTWLLKGSGDNRYYRRKMLLSNAHDIYDTQSRPWGYLDEAGKYPVTERNEYISDGRYHNSMRFDFNIDPIAQWLTPAYGFKVCKHRDNDKVVWAARWCYQYEPSRCRWFIRFIKFDNLANEKTLAERDMIVPSTNYINEMQDPTKPNLRKENPTGSFDTEKIYYAANRLRPGINSLIRIPELIAYGLPTADIGEIKVYGVLTKTINDEPCAPWFPEDSDLYELDVDLENADVSSGIFPTNASSLLYGTLLNNFWIKIRNLKVSIPQGVSLGGLVFEFPVRGTSGVDVSGRPIKVSDDDQAWNFHWYGARKLFNGSLLLNTSSQRIASGGAGGGHGYASSLSDDPQIHSVPYGGAYLVLPIPDTNDATLENIKRYYASLSLEPDDTEQTVGLTLAVRRGNVVGKWTRPITVTNKGDGNTLRVTASLTGIEEGDVAMLIFSVGGTWSIVKEVPLNPNQTSIEIDVDDTTTPIALAPYTDTLLPAGEILSDNFRYVIGSKTGVYASSTTPLLGWCQNPLGETDGFYFPPPSERYGLGLISGRVAALANTRGYVFLTEKATQAFMAPTDVAIRYVKPVKYLSNGTTEVVHHVPLQYLAAVGEDGFYLREDIVLRFGEAIPEDVTGLYPLWANTEPCYVVERTNRIECYFNDKFMNGFICWDVIKPTGFTGNNIFTLNYTDGYIVIGLVDDPSNPNRAVLIVVGRKSTRISPDRCRYKSMFVRIQEGLRFKKFAVVGEFGTNGVRCLFYRKPYTAPYHQRDVNDDKTNPIVHSGPKLESFGIAVEWRDTDTVLYKVEVYPTGGRRW